MVKEIEKAGIPVAHITNMTPVAQGIGSPRIVPGVAITNPCCDANLPLEEQKKQRKNYIQRALTAISTPVSKQQLF